MGSKIAAIQISDTGLKIMIGEIINGVFRSWYHKKVDAYVFENGKVDIQSLKLKLAFTVEEVQRELRKVIDSWCLVYDIDYVKVSKLENTRIGDFYIKRSSINDIKTLVKNKCKVNQGEHIALIKPAQFRWKGKEQTHIQERMPEPGTYLNNLHVNSLIYRTPRIKLEQVYRIMHECGLRIEKSIPSCFCYSHTLTKSVDRKYTSVVDIGNDSTKIMLYFQNMLLGYRTIPVGSFKMTEMINRRFFIKSLTKTVEYIKNDFSFKRNINHGAILHEFVNEQERKTMTLTREVLRQEGIMFANYLHNKINEELTSLLKTKNIDTEIPIFTTGGFTNAEGYQDFLDHNFNMMHHLDVSSIEGLDNGFAALLGMIQLFSEDAIHSGEIINCISEQAYGLINRLNMKFARNTVQKLLKL